MNEETYQALKSILKLARKVAFEKSAKKRKTQSEVWEEAILYRDLVAVESWVNEVAKDY